MSHSWSSLKNIPFTFVFFQPTESGGRSLSYRNLPWTVRRTTFPISDPNPLEAEHKYSPSTSELASWTRRLPFELIVKRGLSYIGLKSQGSRKGKREVVSERGERRERERRWTSKEISGAFSFRITMGTGIPNGKRRDCSLIASTPNTMQHQ